MTYNLMLTPVLAACPPNNIPEQAFNLYLVPKDRKKLNDFLTDTYGIDLDWTYGQVSLMYLDAASLLALIGHWSQIEHPNHALFTRAIMVCFKISTALSTLAKALTDNRDPCSQ